MTDAAAPTRTPRGACALCRDIGHGLDRLMTSDIEQEFQDHVLGAILAWWVTQTLRLYDDTALFAELTKALEEHGIRVETFAVDAQKPH